MARIPLFGTNARQIASTISAQDRVNMYIHPTTDQEAGPFSLISRPGLTTFATTFAGNSRGLIVLPAASTARRYLHVVGDSLYTVDTTNGNAANVGAIGNGGTYWRSAMAANPTQCLIGTGWGVPNYSPSYVYNYSTGVLSTITGNPNAPTTINGACYINGRFIVSDGTTMRASALNDGTTWGALDIATPESAEDPMRTLTSRALDLVVFGTATTEVWQYTGSTGFPFARASTINVGIVSQWAWAHVSGDLMFIGADKNGVIGVYAMSGYTAVKISPPELDRELETLRNGSGLSRMELASLQIDGHRFLVIHPSQYSNPSIVYDLDAKVMATWATGALAYNVRQIAAVAGAGYAEFICAGFFDGKLYKVSGTTDNGATINKSVTTRHLFADEYLSLRKVWLDVEPGCTIGMEASYDRGATWAPARYTSSSTRHVWWNCGRKKNHTMRFSSSTAARLVINGAWGQTE